MNGNSARQQRLRTLEGVRDHFNGGLTMENPTHLGDGAYATFTEWGDVLLTANHHDPQLATEIGRASGRERV